MADIRKFDKKELDKVLSRVNSGNYSHSWTKKVIRELVHYITWSSGNLQEKEVEQNA